MARKRRVIVPLLVLVAAGVGAGIWWQRSHVRDSDGTIVLYGNVDIREVELAFNGTDRIQRVLVSEGDTVHAGQPVAQLDTRRMEAAVAQARAEVAAQEQVLAALEAGTRVEEVRRSEAEVRAAKARAIEAELLLKRTTDAFEHGAATRQEMDRARAEANTAIAALNAAGETLALAVAGLAARGPVTITNAGVAAITFPGFFRMLRACGAQVTEQHS